MNPVKENKLAIVKCQKSGKLGLAKFQDPVKDFEVVSAQIMQSKNNSEWYALVMKNSKGDEVAAEISLVVAALEKAKKAVTGLKITGANLVVGKSVKFKFSRKVVNKKQTVELA